MAESFVAATPELAHEVALKMRDCDVRELSACGVDPFEHVREWGSREDSMIALWGDEPCVVFGVMPGPEFSMPYAVATPLVERHKLTFQKNARRIVNDWAEEHPFMFNFVHESSIETTRWLITMGFAISRDLHEPFSNGELFRAFWRRSAA